MSGGVAPDWRKVSSVLAGLVRVLEAHVRCSEEVLRALPEADADRLGELVEEAGRKLEELHAYQLELEHHWPCATTRSETLSSAPVAVRALWQKLEDLVQRSAELEEAQTAGLQARMDDVRKQLEGLRATRQRVARYHASDPVEGTDTLDLRL